MNYLVKGKTVELPSGKRYAFKYPIHDLVETESGCVVCLEVPLQSKLEENVYSIDSNGKLLWQIPKTKHSMKNSPYLGIRKVGELIRAFNWDGMVYELDPKDGRIVNCYFGR